MLSLLPVAILAGGLATRLRPLTDELPKSLLTVAGRPFIFHQLDLLREQGVKRVVLCIAHLGERIRAAVDAALAPGLSVSYSFDGATLLGTGGALRQALPLLGEEFFVVYGDSYVSCSLQRIQAAYREAQRPALMAITRNDDGREPCNVRFSRGLLLDYDKRAPRPDMRHIDFGVSVLSRTVFAASAHGEAIDLADILHDLAVRGDLAAFEVTERLHEIGSPQGLKDTEEFLARRVSDA